MFTHSYSKSEESNGELIESCSARYSGPFSPIEKNNISYFKSANLLNHSVLAVIQLVNISLPIQKAELGRPSHLYHGIPLSFRRDKPNHYEQIPFTSIILHSTLSPSDGENAKTLFCQNIRN